MDLLPNIDVPDVEAAERFYLTASGLTVGRRFGADFVELRGWPVRLYLLRKDAGTTGTGAGLRRYERHWTPIHPDIVVDDLDAAVALWARARLSSIRLGTPPTAASRCSSTRSAMVSA